MTFAQAIPSVLRQYATFSGRATRSEYWWFYLFTILVGIVCSVVDAGLGTLFDNEIGVVGTIFSLAMLPPTLAVTARRLHDTGRSGWWMLLPIIPLVATLVLVWGAIFTLIFGFTSGHSDISGRGIPVMLSLVVLGVVGTLVASVVLIVFLCLDSQPFHNKYGPSPKAPVAPTWPGYGAPDGVPYGSPYVYPPTQPHQ